MLRARSRYLHIAATWLGMLTLAGCGQDRAETPDAAATRADTAATAGMARTDTAAAGTRLTDANIVALLDEANKSDSAAGALARGKATNQQVKDFARLMMTEHHALRQQGRQLAERLKVTPQPPAENPLTPLVESEMTALRSTAKGAQFDRVYIEQEIAAHKAVLELADDAEDQAQNEQLKALIEQAKPVIQKHLDQAEKIQDALGEATS
jgi:putative membrane protein